MKASPENWSRAYARQALADFQLWSSLQGKAAIPQCQKLHFLQMTCEKLCKSSLCKVRGADPLAYQSSHAYIAKNLAIILLQEISLTGKPPKNSRTLKSSFNAIAREIELLHPSVENGGRRPDNCEYPWINGEEIFVPAESIFPALQLVEVKGGPTFLKLVECAIRRLAL